MAEKNLEASNSNTGSVTRNGFANFMRMYASRTQKGFNIDNAVQCGKEWNELSNARKAPYRYVACRDDDDMDDACCPKTKPCCPKPKPCCPKPCCPPPPCCPSPPCCRKPRCCPKPRCCKPKPCCRKPRCCPPKPCCPKPRCRPCCPKPRCCKPKPCCPKKRRCPPRCKPTCCPKRYKCQKPGPVTNNGYLNFLRVYRRKHCGLSPNEMVMRAARAWCRLPEHKKDRYRRQACKVTKNCRHKRRRVCNTCP